MPNKEWREPGRIQVSAAFRALAGPAFGYERRGPTEVKGAGDIETWWLVPA